MIPFIIAATTTLIGLGCWAGLGKNSSKKKLRRVQVARWREAIDDDFDLQNFHRTKLYEEMRPHLDGMARRAIEAGIVSIRMGAGSDAVKDMLLDRLSGLEDLS